MPSLPESRAATPMRLRCISGDRAPNQFRSRSHERGWAFGYYPFSFLFELDTRVSESGHPR
eukprot:13314375-Heterocapsa_arctica.AAC.1